MRGHDLIKRLRKDLGIPESETTSEEDDYEKRYRKARAKRVEEAGTVDRYRELFNRDYWTDEWLGSGPDPGYQYMETKLGDHDIEIREWRDKYIPTSLQNIPIMDRESKDVRKARKQYQKQRAREVRQGNYDFAYWWLEYCATPEFAKQAYKTYTNDVEGLVDFVCEYAQSVSEYNKNVNQPKPTVDEVMTRIERDRDVVADIGGMKFRRIESAERDRKEHDTDWRENRDPEIPDKYWNEYTTWCKEHPISQYRKKARMFNMGKHFGAMIMRRLAFLKKINRRNHGFHKHILKSGLNMFDPVTGQSFVSEKKMQSYMEKRMKRYDQKRKEFIKLLNNMVKDGSISEDMAIDWMGDTKEARDRVEKRYLDMKKRIGESERRRKKQEKYDQEHLERYTKERDKWFKKFGGDPNKPFTVSFDGEETKIMNIADPGQNPIWKCDWSNGTDYIES